MTTSSARARARRASRTAREPDDDQHGLRRQRGDHDHSGRHRHHGGNARHRGPRRASRRCRCRRACRHEHLAVRSPRCIVRVPTPTREFIVGTGALPAAPRREIADTAQCLKCHVGSLYQHGNTRVDNVTMCIICHNSASSDQNNRVAMGVDQSEAYDGQVGQTYELKTMLHAIHSAGDGPGRRSRSIGPAASMPGRPKSGAACRTGRRTSAPDTRSSEADPAVPASTQPHNFYSPTYPRAFNDCAACHVGRLRPDPRPGQGRGDDARRGRWPRGRTSSTTRCRAPRRPPARAATSRPTPGVMRTRMAGRRRPSRTGVRPLSIRSELMFD